MLIASETVARMAETSPSSWVTVVTAVAGAAAAAAAWISVVFLGRNVAAQTEAVEAQTAAVDAQREATQAHLLHSFLIDYASREMHDAMVRIRRFLNEESDPEGRYREWRDQTPPPREWNEISLARRQLTSFFYNALLLCEKDIVPEEHLKTICLLDGYELFLEAEGLEWAHDPGYDRDRFERLRNTCGDRGVERFTPPP